MTTPARWRLTDLSPRTVQRRFRAATGLTRGAARQIDRTRNAAVLLQEGSAIDDVVVELGYYDHAHLGRALKHYIGRTPHSAATWHAGQAAVASVQDIAGPGS